MSCFAFQADECEIENCEDLRLEDSGVCVLTYSGLRIHALMTFGFEIACLSAFALWMLLVHDNHLVGVEQIKFRNAKGKSM